MDASQQYAPPPAGTPAPTVWWFYVVFCVLIALFGALLCFLGAAMAIAPGWFVAEQTQGPFSQGPFAELMVATEGETMLQGISTLLMGLVLALPYAIAPFIPRSAKAWGIHAVLIAFSFMTCCCMPLSAILLFFWLKPETRYWFGC